MFTSHYIEIESLVVPGKSSTITLFYLNKLFTKLLFPTLDLPF